MTNCAQLNLPGLTSELASKEKESHDPHLCDGLDSGECANLKKSIANDIVALQNEIAFANEQLPICNLILGNWNINANGFTGLLSIEDLDTDGPLIAETFFGSSAADTIKGNWDNIAKKITFTRTISGNTITQDYTGFLFATPSGTEPLIFAGFFTESGVSATFGWTAQKSQ